MKIKLRRLKAELENNIYFIDEEIFYDSPKKEKVEIWANLYVYENGSNVPTQDHLQNDVDMCMRYAFEFFKVPNESWIELEAVEEEL